jgi:hypothetical protein
MIFFRKKAPPLTAFCLKLSAPENIFKIADHVTTRASWRQRVSSQLHPQQALRLENRAFVSSLFIMTVAGDFVRRGLQWDRGGTWEGSRRYLRGTNLDVITAEAIVWIRFLMQKLWKADREDREVYKTYTTSRAGLFALDMIKQQTNVDFTARYSQNAQIYEEATKERGGVTHAFATTILRSVGCRSLAEPLKDAPFPPFDPGELIPLLTNVSAFYLTMPTYYQTFKNVLKEWSDRFPDDNEALDG